MALPEVAAISGPIGEIACDVLVIGAFAGDEGPALASGASDVEAGFDGRLIAHASAAGFKANRGEVLLIPTLGRLAASAVALCGLGNTAEASAGGLRSAAASAARRLSGHTVLASTLHQAVDGENVTDAVAVTAEGFLLGTYSFAGYKNDPRPSKIQRLLVLDAPSEDLRRARVRAEATALARDLTNEPAGSLYPETLAERARQLAEAAGVGCTIWDEEELARRGFGGLLGVGAGSQRPPRLIELHYNPEGARGKVALVGKGVTFDSGGLSLKDHKGMEEMKTDKAGACAVLAAMTALPKLDVRSEVVGLIPATENLPSGSSLKPGDVLRHYGGKTTEVLNTDAEGRLILADALAYASEQAPDAIVDVATLTGSMIVALGAGASGLFSNDEALAKELEAAAEKAGERVWRMPLFDDYVEELDSQVADMKNIATRFGGAIFAAVFLREFVGKDIAWAHLDIAGTARSARDKDEVSRGATGATTRTLIEWVEQRGR